MSQLLVVSVAVSGIQVALPFGHAGGHGGVVALGVLVGDVAGPPRKKKTGFRKRWAAGQLDSKAEL
jgi:hypothetical protein